MRIVKMMLLGLILVAIVLLSLANREVVTVQLLPEPLDGVFQASAELPLFLVSLISILVGMIIGYLLEWLREHKYRRHAAEKAREAERLSRELARAKARGRPDDDVLALIN